MTSRHPVVPVDGTAFAWEVLAIDRVYRILDTSRGEAVVQEFHPLFFVMQASTMPMHPAAIGTPFDELISIHGWAHSSEEGAMPNSIEDEREDALCLKLGINS